jgi:hypothetical protein
MDFNGTGEIMICIWVKTRNTYKRIVLELTESGTPMYLL